MHSARPREPKTHEAPCLEPQPVDAETSVVALEKRCRILSPGHSIRSLRGETMVKVTDSIAERVRRRKEDSQKQAVGIMDELLQIASVRFEEAAAELDRALGSDVSARVFPDEEDKQDWWSWQIIKAAQKHGYYADLDRPRSGWACPRSKRKKQDSSSPSMPSDAPPTCTQQQLFSLTP